MENFSIELIWAKVQIAIMHWADGSDTFLEVLTV